MRAPKVGQAPPRPSVRGVGGDWEKWLRHRCEAPPVLTVPGIDLGGVGHDSDRGGHSPAT
jgi:hypothetical protein